MLCPVRHAKLSVSLHVCCLIAIDDAIRKHGQSLYNHKQPVRKCVFLGAQGLSMMLCRTHWEGLPIQL